MKRPRPKLSKAGQKIYDEITARLSKHAREDRKHRRVVIATLAPEKIDAILHALHAGGAPAGTTYGALANLHGVDVMTLLEIQTMYSDKVTMHIRHASIAEAKAWRAKRRAARKADRAPRSTLPAPTPEGSPS